jgi:hypothetical protein
MLKFHVAYIPLSHTVPFRLMPFLEVVGTTQCTGTNYVSTNGIEKVDNIHFRCQLTLRYAASSGKLKSWPRSKA